MLIKFETKSARVKGLAFHPKRKWILASLHNGVIQLWDYSEKTMIDKFDEHKGPVRGLDFHRHQPLFVSGGDDMKIKVWNYKARRCLFTMDAHEDYIRTTYFHQEHPWIVSASDDQSIRIWNWQSRSKIVVLTGHTHYVMCAQFHPSNEIILSSSIDQTLRLWDISGLKMKNKSKSSLSSREENPTGLPEILSKTDYSVESREAHNSEINWCAFHPDPNKQLCLSAADDNYIKVWKIDFRNGLREIDTLRGHYNNVSSATFTTIMGKDFIISVSEDRTIKVWDLEKRCAISTHRRETDRFWTCAAHPKENLFAAGHDTGILMFKLEKERPAFVVVKDVILYIRSRQIMEYNMKTKERKAIQTLVPRTEMSHNYSRMHCYNYDENQTSQILVSVRSTNVDKSVCDLYRVNRNQYGEGIEPRRTPGLSAIFIGPNRYAILTHSKQVYFKINDEERKPKNPIVADEIFEAGAGKLFIKHKLNGLTVISLWDLEKGCSVASVKCDAKTVIMSQKKDLVACVASNKITICDAQLRVLSTIEEQRKIKSACWEASGVLIYNTSVHMKYALTDGEITTIESSHKVLYIVTIRDEKIICLDRKREFEYIPIDSREFRFKQAVIRNDRGSIISTIKKLGALTRPEISFLVNKGHPGLALRFVKDPEARFPLALKAFDIEEALNCAIKLNSRARWSQLADVALQVGNFEATERAYKELKQSYKLALLYLVTDQKDKMFEARQMAQDMKEISTEFIISLLLKDFEECCSIIRRCGHPNLAYIFAINHGLFDLAHELVDSGEISEEQTKKLPSIPDTDDDSTINDVQSWMNSSIPQIGNSMFKNWPLLESDQASYREIFTDIDNERGNLINEDHEEIAEGFDDAGDWDELEDELDDDDIKPKVDKNKSTQDENVEDEFDKGSDGWQDDDDPLEDLPDDDYELEDLDDDLEGTSKGNKAEKSIENLKFTPPNPGQSLATKWIQNSDVPVHHVLAGSYRSAIRLLEQQIALTKSEPLLDIFKDLYMQSRVASKGLALQPTMMVNPMSSAMRFDDEQDDALYYNEQIVLPTGGYTLEDLEKRLTDCYNLFTGGKFADAIDKFRNLLFCTIFMQSCEDNDSISKGNGPEEHIKRAKEIIAICKEYILALQIWLERKNITGKSHEENKRSCELAAYFSKLNLPKHRTKIFEKAFEVFLVKPKEFQKTRAASFIAQRLLDFLPAVASNDPKKEKMINYAKKVKASFDPEVDQQIQLAFDDLNPYSICAASFTPIYAGNESIKCSLCQSVYKPSYSKSNCRVCLISELGKPCTGLRFKITPTN